MISLIALWLVVAAQLNPSVNQQTGSIEGVVLKLGTTEPLPGTRVMLLKLDAGNTPAYATTMTEGDGRFRLANVEPGVYRVLASRTDGFLAAEYGQTRPNTRGIPVSVSISQELKDIRLAMAPPASITGRVLDPDGDPVPNAQVQALKWFYRDGKRELTIAQTIHANDLGEYRLFWLAPAQYLVSARGENPNAASLQGYIRRPEDQGVHESTSAPVVNHRRTEDGQVIAEVHVPVYFPGTTDLRSATVVPLQSGDNRGGVDIKLTGLPPARKIRGIVIDGQTGQPAAAGSIRAVLKDSSPNVSLPYATVNSKGEFEITGAIAGVYTLFAGLSASPGFFGGRNGRTTVEVGAKDLENIAVVVPPGIDLGGRFIVEGVADIDFTKLSVNLTPYPATLAIPFAQRSVQNGAPNPNQPAVDGTFMLREIGVGDYRFSAGGNGPGVLPPGFYTKSIRLAGEETLGTLVHLDKKPDGGLEILFANDVGTVAGTVQNEGRDAIPNSAVVLVPENRSRSDLYKTATSDVSGRFQFRNIPAGEYKLFAWDEVENGAWRDPEFMSSYEARGVAAHVRDKATETVSVTLIRRR